jgi:methylated-DNA-protein-cysteine methyltransferase-like protein
MRSLRLILWSLTSDMDTFAQRLYTIIAAIPLGKVTTYGTLARLAGSSRAARQVGAILHFLPKDSTLP